MRRWMFLSVSLCLTVLLLPSCAQRPGMVVFFSRDSVVLDGAARGIIQDAGTVALANPSAPVTVVGFASPETGTVEENKALAGARAQGVADALVAAGVPRERIRVQPWGALPSGLTPTESRRVKIVVG